MSALDELVHEASADMAARKERRIKGLLGIEFRQTIDVQVRKPGWMPQWLYRRLMRTIVVVETPTMVAKIAAQTLRNGPIEHDPD